MDFFNSLDILSKNISLNPLTTSILLKCTINMEMDSLIIAKIVEFHLNEIIYFCLEINNIHCEEAIFEISFKFFGKLFKIIHFKQQKTILEPFFVNSLLLNCHRKIFHYLMNKIPEDLNENVLKFAYFSIKSLNFCLKNINESHLIKCSIDLCSEILSLLNLLINNENELTKWKEKALSQILVFFSEQGIKSENSSFFEENYEK